MRTLIITTDQTDDMGIIIEHNLEVTEAEAKRVLGQFMQAPDWIIIESTDGTHAIRSMDVHMVTVK